MLVGVLSKVVPVGSASATVLSASDQARLDRAFLVPHQWASHYAARYGALEDFLRHHPERFAFRPDGAVYQLEPPAPAPPAAAAPPAASAEEDGSGISAGGLAAVEASEAGGAPVRRKGAGAEQRRRGGEDATGAKNKAPPTVKGVIAKPKPARQGPPKAGAEKPATPGGGGPRKAAAPAVRSGEAGVGGG